MVSNSKTESVEVVPDVSVYQNLVNEKDDFDKKFWLHKFDEGPYISSYMYNLCAG